MKIWICRHGETDVNKQHRIQGIMDEPLNEEGVRQAHAVGELIKDVRFDAVYSSPLDRAKKTACIAAGVDESELIIDNRISEIDFGKYDGMPYLPSCPWEFGRFWLLPWIFPAPDTVETVSSMKERISSFFEDLEGQNYENVLIACHGGIMRVMSGRLENRISGLKWYPKPVNCEIRVYEIKEGKSRLINRLFP